MNLSRILKSFFSLSALTMLSRASGFIKVAAIAAFYGRSIEADMLTAVMILPDLVYKFLSEGIVSGAAVPLFVKEKDNPEKLNKAFWSLFWVTAGISLIVSLLLALGTNQICALIMPDVGVNAEVTLRKMWELLIPYLVLGMLSGVQTSLLNAKMSFAKPAVGNVLVNLCIILGIFVVHGGPVEVIALSNTIGALIQFIWLFWLIRNEKTIETGLKKIWIFEKEIAKEFVVASSPIVAWVSILPLIPLYERHLLANNQGSIATLNYIEKLFNLPLGVISISLAQVILPNLSSLEGKTRIRFLGKTLGFASLVILPIVTIIWFGADLIVKIVFMRGKFSLEDVTIAASLFRVYAIALLPASLNMVLNRGFFANKKYRIPFVAGLIAALTQLYICYKMVPLKGISGIAIAAISAGILQFIILVVALVRSASSLRK